MVLLLELDSVIQNTFGLSAFTQRAITPRDALRPDVRSFSCLRMGRAIADPDLMPEWNYLVCEERHRKVSSHAYEQARYFIPSGLFVAGLRMDQIGSNSAKPDAGDY